MANVESVSSIVEFVEFQPTTLKDLRKSLNLTQREAARDLDVSRTQYVKWERSIDSMSIRTLRTVCDYYGCHPCDLI